MFSLRDLLRTSISLEQMSRYHHFQRCRLAPAQNDVLPPSFSFFAAFFKQARCASIARDFSPSLGRLFFDRNRSPPPPAQSRYSSPLLLSEVSGGEGGFFQGRSLASPLAIRGKTLLLNAGYNPGPPKTYPFWRPFFLHLPISRYTFETRRSVAIWFPTPLALTLSLPPHCGVVVDDIVFGRRVLPGADSSPGMGRPAVLFQLTLSQSPSSIEDFMCRTVLISFVVERAVPRNMQA